MKLSEKSTGNALKLSTTDKIQELIPHTILDLQKFVVADAGNSVSAVVESNHKFHYFIIFIELGKVNQGKLKSVCPVIRNKI